MKRFCSVSAVLLLCAVLILSCKKDTIITSPNARLGISADTLKFDTVFTTTGSVTQSFKIRNENSQRLVLSNIKLMGGDLSPFRININGTASNMLSNVEIAANDSMYIFVSVTVDPTSANLPFVISDSISVEFNSNQRFIQLQAYGQNAHFLRAQSITTNTSWNNTLPYVILDFLQVAPGAELTIPKGTKIYSHANAPFVIDGTLNANGTVGEPIIFNGDRLDEPYKNFPGSWPGIFFRQTSQNNTLQFVEVKNAYQGVVVLEPSTNANPKVILSECIVENAYGAGIFCSNTSLVATNVLISNCANNVFLEAGGTYQFTHCTAASFTNNYLSHRTPVLSVSNFSAQVANANPLQANFVNCIFWGDKTFIEDEINIKRQNSSSVFSIVLDHCLYRGENSLANATITSSIKNQDPLFDSVDVNKRYFDFRTSHTFAPGVNKGVNTGVIRDLDNLPRPVGLADIGCYEKQ